MMQKLKKGISNPNRAYLYLKDNAPINQEIQQVGFYYGIPFWLSKMYHRRLDPPSNPVSIWDRDWDLLIVLDACRSDMMKVCMFEYPFLNSMETIWSVGGHSKEWLENTFKSASSDLIRETAYVTGNHHSDTVKDLPFAAFKDLQTIGLQDELPAPPAHVVTDSAINVDREKEFDRLIVHYMQPHKPFISKYGERTDVQVKKWSTGWELYQNYITGGISKRELWQGFVNNLQYVLSEVALLLENIDAPRTVITSDHGNAFGEDFLWDHEIGVQHPSMRRVPWIETTASDKNTVSPSKYDSYIEDQKTEKRLEQLGYIT
jgi:hypothetical protein